MQQNLVLFIPATLPELKLSINLIAKCERMLDSLAHTDGTDLIKGMKFDLQTVYADIPNGYYWPYKSLLCHCVSVMLACCYNYFFKWFVKNKIKNIVILILFFIFFMII